LCGRKLVQAGHNLEQVGRSREGSVRLRSLNTLYVGEASDSSGAHEGDERKRGSNLVGCVERAKPGGGKTREGSGRGRRLNPDVFGNGLSHGAKPWRRRPSQWCFVGNCGTASSEKIVKKAERRRRDVVAVWKAKALEE